MCVVLLPLMSTNKQTTSKKYMERCTPQRRLYWNIYWYVKMFSFSFLPSYLWLFPSIQQPCQVQPHATMCNIPSEEMSGFPMGSGGQGRLSLHVSCCSVSFFQLSMSHVLAWRYQKQVLGWRSLDCVALLLNYVESAQLFLAPAKQVVESQHWWLWERCSGKGSTQVPQVRSMRGKMLSWKILRPGLVFVWNTVSCLKVFLYTPQWCLP